MTIWNYCVGRIVESSKSDIVLREVSACDMSNSVVGNDVSDAPNSASAGDAPRASAVNDVSLSAQRGMLNGNVTMPRGTSAWDRSFWCPVKRVGRRHRLSSVRSKGW